nr:MAG TPA: hypothetical protein [Caudoviricetes sp.]
MPLVTRMITSEARCLITEDYPTIRLFSQRRD